MTGIRSWTTTCAGGMPAFVTVPDGESRRRDLNRSAMKIAAAHKIAYISFNDGPILPQCANSAPG
jgi:hypothetical protein